MRRIVEICLTALLASPALHAQPRLAIDETAKGEMADKNRFSARAVSLDALAGAGLEYERALALFNYSKPAIATSINTIYQAKSDGAKQVKSAEYTSFVDVSLRYIIVPFAYAQVFIGGGATLFSTTVKLSDASGTGRQVEGAGNFAGVQLMGEVGVRLTFGPVSVGSGVCFSRPVSQNINFTYQSGAFQLPDSVSYAPLANSRLHFFIGYLF